MEKKTVLFVDDEEKVLTSLRRDLVDEPYNTHFANSGERALEIIQRKPVHVIVADIRMPEMGGLELLMAVKEKYLDIIRMVLSGYAQMSTLLTAINQWDIFRSIPKPKCSTYQRSISNLASHVTAFRPLTWAHPVMPGFASCRRACSGV